MNTQGIVCGTDLFGNCIESCSLAYQEGTSDKVYIVSITKDVLPYSIHDGSPPLTHTWTTRVAYGRRGGTLNQGVKGAFQSLEKAQASLEKIVVEKMGKGYKQVSHTRGANESPAGFLVQPSQAALPSSDAPPCLLLNAIEEEEAESLLQMGGAYAGRIDHRWVVEPKIDGERLQVKVTEAGIEGFNRRGVRVLVAADIQAELQNFPVGVTLDGELARGTYYIFDAVDFGMANDENLQFHQRRERLELIFENLLARRHLKDCLIKYALGAAFSGAPSTTVVLVPSHPVTASNGLLPPFWRTYIQSMRKNGHEGVVLKKVDAKYRAGRPNSGGDYLKLKFWESVTCVVLGHNAGSSVQVGLLSSDSGHTQPCGNVTIPITGSEQKPPIGEFIEVRYLYATGTTHGRTTLYQPVFEGLRPDKSEPDSVCSLKFPAKFVEGAQWSATDSGIGS